MMYYKYIISLFCIFCPFFNKISAQNIVKVGYRQTEIINIENIKSENDVHNLGSREKTLVREFVDGFGRPIQTVTKQGSPLLKDLIQSASYDRYGNSPVKYLPYVATTSDASFQTLTSAQSAFYANGTADKVADDSKPYTSNIYESSPLQRVLKSGNIGDGFQTNQKFKSVVYRTNTSLDNVRLWNQDGSSTSLYSVSSLSVTEMTDERGYKSISFLDKEGKLILKRVQADETIDGKLNIYLDTYYIYNDAGNIKFMIPPKAVAVMKNANSWVLNSVISEQLIYSYLYDDLGRVVEKKNPGSAAIYIIYDSLDRPVLVQDGNQRASKKWYYTKSDISKRIVSSGIYTNTVHLSRVAMQAFVNTINFDNIYYEERLAGATHGYTNLAFPSENVEPQIYYYYDNYDLNNDGSADYKYQSQALPGEAPARTQVRGFLTAVKKKILGTSTWLTNVNFYDKRGFSIQILSNSLLNTTVADNKTIIADFRGKVIRVKTVKKALTITTSALSEYSYDHMGRITAIDDSYNSASAIRIAAYSYNEIGQLVRKRLHRISGGETLEANVTLAAANSVTSGATSKVRATNTIRLVPGFTAASGSTFSASIVAGEYLQSVDYRYNIRGQMTSINNSTLTADHKNEDTNDVFGMEMLYENADAGIGNTGIFTGQLSAVKWQTKSSWNITGKQGSYRFEYDKLTRLKNALYSERLGSGAWSNRGEFDEKNVKYDENGNILSLQRNAYLGGSIIDMDNLQYTYEGNRLTNVVDNGSREHGFKNLTSSAATYTYNSGGSLITDPKKGITLSYNELNKTAKIIINTTTGRYINYIYDATGIMVRKQQYDKNVLQKTTDYIDGFVFENNKLAFFSMTEGRVRNTGTGLKPEYILKDFQGNARVSFEEKDGQVVVRQENNFYPFGMVMTGGVLPTEPNRNLYNGGSEWQNDFSDLPDYYNTYYRNYDATLGRFIAIDPLADENVSFTPYHYAINNPIGFNDPLGDKQSPLYGTIETLWNSQYGGTYTTGTGSISTFQSHVDSFGFMDEYLSKGNYWGNTDAGNFNSAFSNFIMGKSADSSSELALRLVEHTETRTNKDWLIERQKEAWGELSLGGEANQGGGWDNSKLALDIGGGLYGAMETAVRPGEQWLGKNGKYYNNSWGGNQYTGSRSGAFKAASGYRLAGGATVVATVVIGGIETYNGYQRDGGQFAYNAQSAAAQTVGGIGGGIGGAALGAKMGAGIGIWFGGFGAIPGAVIGGVVVGFLGGSWGSSAGQGAVNIYHGR